MTVAASVLLPTRALPWQEVPPTPPAWAVSAQSSRPAGDQAARSPDTEVSEHEQEQIAAFIQAHDASFCRNDLDGLLGYYASDFCSDAYVAVFDRNLMRRTYERILENHRDVSLTPSIPRLQRLGPYYAACVCQEFTGISTSSGHEDSDHWCQLYLLEQREPGLSIVRLYEYDHDFLPHVTKPGEVYQNSKLMFSLTPPPNYLMIRQTFMHRYVDRLRYVGDSLDVELSVGLLVNDDHQPLAERVEHDRRFLASRAASLRPLGDPVPFEATESLRGLLVESQLDVTPDCALAKRTLSRGSIKLSRLYLTPDDRALFVLTLKGPVEDYAARRKALLKTARSLELTCDPPEAYWATLAERSGWGVLSPLGHYSNPGLGISFDVPDGWLAEILPVATPEATVVKMRPPREDREALIIARFSPDPHPDLSLEDLVDKTLELPEWAPEIKGDNRKKRRIKGIGQVLDAARVFQSPGCDEQRADTIFFRHQGTFGRLTLYTSSEDEVLQLRPFLETCIQTIRLRPPER